MSIAFSTRQPCDETAGTRSRTSIPCDTSRRPWVLTAAILGSSLAFIEGSVVNLALPDLQVHLDLSAVAVQWVVNLYLLVVSAFLLIGGASGDRFGLRRVFVCGILIFGAASTFAAVSASIEALLIARAMQALAAAAVIPTSLALISVHFPENERGKAIGLWAGASALTTALGPVLGGVLVDQFGWPSVFLAMVPLAGLTALVALLRVPVSKPQNRASLDVVGAILLASALSGATFASLQTTLSMLTILILGSAVASAFAWVVWEQRVQNPMVPLRLFADRRFAGANVMTVLLYFALTGVLYFLPFNLIQIQGYSAAQAGAAFLPLTLLIGIGSGLFGHRLSNLAPHRVLGLGAAITAVGYLAMSLPAAPTTFVCDWLPGIILVGMGMTLCVAPLTTVVMTAVTDSEAGVASGINNTASRIAGVLAIALLSAIALTAFEGGLLSYTDSPLSTNEREYLVDNAHQLGGLTADTALTETQRMLVQRAYVRAFRIILWMCSAMAFLSAAIAWFSLRAPRSKRIAP